MTVKTKTVQMGKLNLCLPVFSSDETPEAELMNSFYDSLAEKISAYATNSPSIRRYCVNHQVTEDDGTIDVLLKFSVRVLDDFGEVNIHRRELLTQWHDTKLSLTQIHNI